MKNTRGIPLFIFLLFLCFSGCILNITKSDMTGPSDANIDQHEQLPDVITDSDLSVDEPLDDSEIGLDSISDGDNEEDCIPATCGSAGLECGVWLDGCGNLMDCGECSQHFSECVEGVCRCIEGYTMCSSQCVNLSTDNNNCGFCDNSCHSGWKCEDGECIPECPDGWIYNIDSGYAWCISPYQGTGTCCLAWDTCLSLGAQPGCGRICGEMPELASFIPAIVLNTGYNPGYPDEPGECNFRCWEEDGSGNPSSGGSTSIYDCTAANCNDLTTCSGIRNCGGTTLTYGCSCQHHFWCYIEISP